MAKHILVVDDEAANLPAISLVLRKAGFCVWQAHHPVSALHMAANGIPAMDLLLVDLLMPRFTGTQLAEKLREYFPYMSTLYMTGMHENQWRHLGLELEPWQVLRKPLQFDRLVEFVKTALVASAETVALPRLPQGSHGRGSALFAHG